MSEDIGTLTAKARAYDAHLWAFRHLADNARDIRVPQWAPSIERAYREGYNDALTDLHQLISEAPPTTE